MCHIDRSGDILIFVLEILPIVRMTLIGIYANIYIIILFYNAKIEQ